MINTSQLFWFLFFAIPIFLISVFLKILQQYRKKKIERQERSESLTEGGVEEAKPYRELRDEEKKELENLVKNSARIKNNAWWLLPLFLLVDLLLAWWLKTALDLGAFDVGDFNKRILIYSIVAPLFVFIQLYLIRLYCSEKDRYLDLRSPVFRVQGQAIKEETQRSQGHNVYGPQTFITVRRITFSNVDFPDMADFFETIKRRI